MARKKKIAEPGIVGARKFAFHSVFKIYRNSLENICGVRAVNISDSSKGKKKLVTLADLKIDVDKVIERCFQEPLRTRVYLAYTSFDGNEIDCERFAQMVLGDQRHGIELGLVALFIKKGIDRNYFKSVNSMPAGLPGQVVLATVDTKIVSEKEVRRRYTALRLRNMKPEQPVLSVQDEESQKLFDQYEQEKLFEEQFEEQEFEQEQEQGYSFDAFTAQSYGLEYHEAASARAD